MSSGTSKISERLTLELDGPEITAEKFEKGIDAFIAIIKDVAKKVTGKAGAVKWLVTVIPGSTKVIFTPHAERVPPSEIPAVVSTIMTGLIAIEQGGSLPPHFSDRARMNTRRLAEILDGGREELDRVQVWRNATPHHVTTRSLANVDSYYGIESRDWGTIEGTLDMVSDRRGRLRFSVADPVTGREVQCYFEDEILDDVLDSFRQRVSVSGMIRYRRQGEPDSINVEEFSAFPHTEDLPDFESVRGILRGGD
jgi:hypothetical protein